MCSNGVMSVSIEWPALRSASDVIGRNHYHLRNNITIDILILQNFGSEEGFSYGE